MIVKITLRNYLKRKGLTAYQLAKSLPDSRQPTIYRLASEKPPSSIDLEVLGRVVRGLRVLTGEQVSPNDILEVVDEPAPKLKSLKPGEVGEARLTSTPAQGKFRPRGPVVVARGGKTTSEIIVQQREERARAVAGMKR
jgi:hypothetical protein